MVVGDIDVFSHEDYVDRLITVIREVSTAHTSANVALYGAWGSGKSGVSNLLEERLEKEKNRFEYAYFDAFKYARHPLLRNFISRLARSLLPAAEADRYDRRLYESTTRARLEFPKLSVRVGRTFRWAAGVALFLALVVPTGRLVSVIPTALLVALLGLAARYLTLNTTVAAPGSEEEFERVFSDLLAQLHIDGGGERRLVVFVDELDRCAADEVGATLETLRTFLGVSGCIFVVAADQHVLEHALTEKVRQSTPADVANPYYSAGNAYLDKIFQYQLALPPLRTRRLTHFALELLKGRGGVWERVDQENVVSVLLPTHVQSPRRVKVLLNSFALTYRIAEARAARDHLKPDLPARAAELAKLVCLRTEFPLFARDLGLDSRLSQAVVVAAEVLEGRGEPHLDERLQGLPVEVRERAILYASGRLPGAQSLVEADAEPAGGGPLLDYEPWEAPEEDEDGGEEPSGLAATPPIRRAHALQLVRYLEKTAEIRGPGSDFIHLEAAGAVWDLDPEAAEEIERDALNNRSGDVIGLIGGLDDLTQRQNATLMLGQLARESVGADAGNVIRVLLGVVDEAEVPLETVAARLVQDVETYQRRRTLRPHDLPGALSLALRGGSSALTESLLTHDAALTDGGFRNAILEFSRELLPAFADRVSEVCAAGLRLSGESTAWVVASLPAAIAEPLLREAQTMAQVATASELSAEDDEVVGRGEDALEQISAAIDALSADRPYRLAEIVLLALLGLPGSRASEYAREQIIRLGPLETGEATAAVLSWANHWALTEFVPLILALDPAVVAGLPDASALLDRFGATLWVEIRHGADDIPDDLFAHLEAFRREGAEAEGEKDSGCR